MQQLHLSRAISPVVGVILLVAVTVVLSSTVGFFVFELAESPSSGSAQAGVSVTETANGEAQIQVVDGGNADSVIVRYEDGTETQLGVGESVTIPDSETATVLAEKDGSYSVLKSVDASSDSGDTAYSVPQDQLVAHYDTTELSLTDGDPVDTLPDMSGTGNTATQSDSTKQPTYVADGIGGTPAIQLDGSNDWLRIPNDPSLDVTSDREYEMIIVFQTTSTSRGFLVGKRTTTGQWGPHYLLEVHKANDVRSSFTDNSVHSDNDVSYSGISDGTPHMMSGLWTGNSNELRVDGATVNTLDASSVTGFDGSGGVDGALGVHYDGEQFTGYYQGHIGEVLIYDRTLTDEERTELEQHLAEKWGI